MSSKAKEHRNTETDRTFAKQTESAETLADSPRQEEIRYPAYEIYIARDGQPGDELSDWLQAERELEAKARNAQA
jgi:hypothetical protein